jgi:hypothetical protein
MEAKRTSSVIRRIGVVVLGVVALALLLAAALAFSSSDRLRTLASIRQVDGYPLYVMHYYGDYGLRAYAPATRPSSRPWPEGELGAPDMACTCFASLSPQGDRQFGRSFDWYDRASLLLFTHPRQGYASVSMVDIAYLGFRSKGPSLLERGKLLSTPYWPFDGLNERGLAVGMMAVPSAAPSQDPEKTTIGSLLAMRLVLDYCANVEEAIALLDHYNIDFRGGPPLHYLVADAAGNSAVLEFVDGQMNVLRATEPWQVATNFALSGTSFAPDQAPCARYQAAYDALSRAGGRISQEEAMAILERVSQQTTMWSVAYNMTSGEVRCAMGRRYDQVKGFGLSMRKVP